MTITPDRQQQYMLLIEKMLEIQEEQVPKLLESQPALVDSGLVGTMVQVASFLAHESDGAKAQFLVKTARKIAIQLGLYPQLTS